MLLGQELCRQYKGETPPPPCDHSAEFCFTGKTDEEYSLVCATGYVPANVIRRDDGWKGFRIQGILDFSLVGILSKIAALLAENSIPIFAISTYNTDYENGRPTPNANNGGERPESSFFRWNRESGVQRTNNRVIAGVCGAIAQELGWNVTLVRVLVVG